MNQRNKFPTSLVVSIAVGSAIFFVGRNLMTPREIVPWRSDFSAAQKEAADTGKPLFIDFTATWCGPCQSLKTTTWADKSVAAALSGDVPVQVDLDAHPDLAAKYQVDSIPAFFVVDPKADKIVKQNREGALDPEEFLAWLKG